MGLAVFLAHILGVLMCFSEYEVRRRKRFFADEADAHCNILRHANTRNWYEIHRHGVYEIHRHGVAKGECDVLGAGVHGDQCLNNFLGKNM